MTSVVYNHEDMALDEIARRALAAYFETGGGDLPKSARVQRLRGKQYAVLRKGDAVLACYRVRNDGKLKRLVRLPEGL